METEVQAKFDALNTRTDLLFSEMLHVFTGINTKLDILTASMNQRFDVVNQRFDVVNQRFDAVSQRFDGLQGEMTARFDALQIQINADRGE